MDKFWCMGGHIVKICYYGKAEPTFQVMLNLQELEQFEKNRYPSFNNIYIAHFKYENKIYILKWHDYI